MFGRTKPSQAAKNDQSAVKGEKTLSMKCSTALSQKNKIYTDLVASWLRTEVGRLSTTLEHIEKSHTYDDEYVREAINAAEVSLRQINKFIKTN
jgi:hypothetical protein